MRPASRRREARRLDGLHQALEFIKATAALGGGAVMLWIVYEVGDLVLPWALQYTPGGYGGVQMNDWFKIGLDVVLPATFLFLAFFYLVARGVVNSGRGY